MSVFIEKAKLTATFQRSLESTGAKGLGSFILNRCSVSFLVSPMMLGPKSATPKAKFQIFKARCHPNQSVISRVVSSTKED